MKKKIIFALCLLFNLNAYADIMPAVNEVAEKTGISNWLLLSIAKVESDFRPYAVNVAGRVFYPKDQDEAKAIIEQALTDGKSFDVGLMQINSFWFRRYELHPSVGLDLNTNLYLAAAILKYELDRNGYRWDSVGLYHSKTERRAENYAEVVAHYARYYREILENEFGEE